ncbi:hypothetical protein KSP40_PGU004101 [Platanthera guangdongensis]|uniref:Uncharacterized protein n=1 Tax=Platanthera guangdongensis TaxID=2320717 RepID=A0ABR2M5I7_9ASPA
MHDLVHDLARSVASDECLIVDPSSSNKNLSRNSRYASFIMEPLSTILQSLNDAKKLRTLYMFVHAEENKDEQKRVNEVLHVISSNVNLLRALRIGINPLTPILPDSFKKLKHLRYLDLSNTQLNSFPPAEGAELEDMTELEEWCNVGEEQFLPCVDRLSLLDCSKLKELPSDIPLVYSLKMNVDDKLLLLSLQNGAFPNLKSTMVLNYDRNESQMSKIIIERSEIAVFGGNAVSRRQNKRIAVSVCSFSFRRTEKKPTKRFISIHPFRPTGCSRHPEPNKSYYRTIKWILLDADKMM